MSAGWQSVEVAAADLEALAAHYIGVRFTMVRFMWRDDQELRPTIHIIGSPETLQKHGFIRREWRSLPRCGVRNHRTKGFGSGLVKRHKNGLLVHGHYEDGLDKIAPVLVAPLLERFVRGPAAQS